MRGGTVVRSVVVVCLVLAGCTNLGTLSFSGPRSPRARGPQDDAAAPRASGHAVAQAGPIPLVPVPPPPLPGDRGPCPVPTPAPAAVPTPAPPTPVVPASAPSPALPPVPGNEPPPPTPPTPSPAPAVAPAATPATPVPPAATPGTVTPRQLQREAAQTMARIDSYIARMRRREQVNGKNQPEEVMLFKFRKAPWGVYFKWLGTVGQGREVVFVQGRHESKIHTLLAAGDHPFLGAGKRMSIAPDSIFVRSASRHPITEAGIGRTVERLGVLLDAQERGDRSRGTLTALGPQSRPEYPHPLHVVEQTIPPRIDAALPRGGRRLIGFDPESHLPVLIITHDDAGQEVEYYCYDRLQFPVKLDDEDFDPDRLWGKPGASRR